VDTYSAKTDQPPFRVDVAVDDMPETALGIVNLIVK
jgi:hypothetical protein